MRAVTEDKIAALVDAGFEFICERRVHDFLDVERVLAAADAVATEARLPRLVARFAIPARQRFLERAEKSSVLLGAWLPDAARDAIATLLGMPAPIPRPLVDKVVADEHVRESARAMLHETMTSFIHKAFAVTPGGRGLRGVIGLGARAAGGLFGGLGEELQRQLEERVRDFVDSGVEMMQRRVAQRLVSDETARLLGTRRRAIFLDLLKRPESDVARLVARLPWMAIDALAPSLVTHNLARAEVRAALKDELSAVIADLSTQTIGELLDELGLREIAREGVRVHLLPLARAFASSSHFQGTLAP
ncbi:MAG: hypothetical protein JWN44_1589 [Myxococcales bacterium]|nr:hypothetical protein [Myxococcales bacterium]